MHSIPLVLDRLLPVLGALSGVVVGFWLNGVRERRKERRELCALARMLGSEVYFETVQAKETLTTMLDLQVRFRAGEHLIKGEHLEEQRLSIYAANLSRIGSLPTDLAIHLQAFHTSLVGLLSVQKRSAQNFEAYYAKQPGVTKLHVEQRLQDAIERAAQVVEVGRYLLAIFKEMFPPEDPNVWAIETERAGEVQIFRRGKAAGTEG
jgi:hypothetical protein